MNNKILSHPLLDAALQNFIKFGIKKTSMSDIALAAGVSRPTLYASFKNKDDVLAGVIRAYKDKCLLELRQQVAQVNSLSDMLDIYFDVMVVSAFDLFHNSPNVENAYKYFDESALEAAKEASIACRLALVDMFTPYQASIESHGQNVEQLAHYVASAGSSFRKTVSSRDDLLALLASAKVTVLAIV